MSSGLIIGGLLTVCLLLLVATAIMGYFYREEKQANGRYRKEVHLLEEELEDERCKARALEYREQSLVGECSAWRAEQKRSQAIMEHQRNLIEELCAGQGGTEEDTADESDFAERLRRRMADLED